MHELSIALNILDWAGEEAQRRGVRVRGIHLRLGPLSGVVADALRFAFEVAREGCPLADAQLIIEETPVLAHCPTCQASRKVVSVQQMCCAVCGTPTGEVQGGRELEVVALEIE
jgi:hydrogenase nickel incorporation protein HypA/HybF